MKALSLFSGIGGFDLGFEWAGIETIGQVEIDDYCTKILERHWPNVKRWRDIRTVTAQSVLESIGRPDIIAGGFPCQDISGAGGSAKGIDGDKSGLWREMFRLIESLRPDWVLIENSPLLRVRGADQLFADLESIDYACRPSVVGAYLTGLPQYRARAYILAYPVSFRPKAYAQHDKAAQCRSASGPVGVLVPKGQGLAQESGEHPRFIPVKPRVAITANGVPWRLAGRAVGNSIIPTIAYVYGKFMMEHHHA